MSQPALFNDEKEPIKKPVNKELEAYKAWYEKKYGKVNKCRIKRCGTIDQCGFDFDIEKASKPKKVLKPKKASYERKANGKLTPESLVQYLTDNQDLIKAEKLTMKEMSKFSGCHRDTIKKKAVENGLAYKAEEKGWSCPIGLWNVAFSSARVKSFT